MGAQWIDPNNPASWKRPALKEEQMTLAIDLSVRVQDEAEHLYLVWGGSEPHWVRLEPFPECDCGDHEYRDHFCKHICCAMLEAGYPEALTLMARIVKARRAAARNEPLPPPEPGQGS